MRSRRGPRDGAAMTDLRLDADKRADHTTAIQALLDRLKADGGGRLVIPPGRWTCGTIHLPPCAICTWRRGSAAGRQSESGRYTENRTIAGEYGGNAGGFLISAVDGQVSISGTGTIDGCGREYMDGWWVEDGYIRTPKDWRWVSDCFPAPACASATSPSVTPPSGPCITGCEAWYRRYHHQKRFGRTHDGIDPDHCRNVRISNCHIEAGDDGIVLKNTKDYRHLGAAKTSSSTTAPSSPLRPPSRSAPGQPGPSAMSLCRAAPSPAATGASPCLRDDGDVEDLLFSDCLIETRLFHTKWWGSAEPIYLVTNPATMATRWAASAGCISAISVAAANAAASSPAGPAHIEDVSMDGVHFHVENTSMARWPPDRRPAHSQEHGGLEWGDTPGLRIEHARTSASVTSASAGAARVWFGPPSRCTMPATSTAPASVAPPAARHRRSDRR